MEVWVECSAERKVWEVDESSDMFRYYDNVILLNQSSFKPSDPKSGLASAQF